MNGGGADISKVKLEYYSENYRGVVATVDIKKGEDVLFVPHSLILTLDSICDSPICKSI